MLQQIEIIQFDNTQSYTASKIYSYLVRKGLKIEMRDILISACAISKNIKIITNNKKHFTRIPELQFY
jgi:predicted nucleic acid-binding protein